MTVAATAVNGRPAQAPEQLESASLHRAAALAEAVLKAMRAHPDRNAFPSVRVLKEWLAGVQYSNDDLGASLALLEAKGLIEWPPVGLGQPRPGSLPKADAAPELSPELRLGRLIVEVVRPGNGRRDRSTRA